MEASAAAGKRSNESSSSSGIGDPSNPSPSAASATSKRPQPYGDTPSKIAAAASGDTVFRLLCPCEKTGCVIGKGGAVIRQIREETGARVRIEDPVPGSDERVVIVTAEAIICGEEASPAQRALVRVFERVVRGEEGKGVEKEVQETMVCRLLAPGCYVGCVLGKGGKTIEKIRQDSGAQIRVLAKEQVPLCAVAGDELVQISGSFSAVRKALLIVSSCLQDNIRVETTTFPTIKLHMGNLQGPAPHAPLDTYPQRDYFVGPHGPDYHPRAYSSNLMFDKVASSHRKPPEEEVVFRMLCPSDKVGSLIGKSGVVVRSLQSETGASISILDSINDSDERIILISAVENLEFNRSPAQDAVLRIHSKLIEGCIEKGPISARLLVPAQQIGCLLGRGGSIIADMRRITGANIRIFVKEHVPRCAQPNDELVQVVGNFQVVREALLHITGRIRETFFPAKQYNFGVQQLSHGPDMPPPFRPRNDAPSPHSYPAVGVPHVVDPSIESPRGRSITSPRLWTPKSGNPQQAALGRFVLYFDSHTNYAFNLLYFWPYYGSVSQAGIAPSKTVTVAVPQPYMGFIHGDNGGNLTIIREVSGANVTVYDPKPGMFEGSIVISGTPQQTSTAQGLLHAFILRGT
ncbi:KH domain-containing protein [Apostasia shenzhenica]|uniref:KH domain-containing protein n=1 Tax=Apostasia shenzhenica TaxID=1088818 RepID=A0A2I0APN5_9ASPA|nr:KH domain-containing protein [Apostasia shenzhenica]